MTEHRSPDQPATAQRFLGRREDRAFLRGSAHYVADLSVSDLSASDLSVADLSGGVLHVGFVRSPMAHGIIRTIDTTVAESAPGVEAVYTADTIGLGPFVHLDGYEHGAEQSRYPLAKDRVRHVGEALAMVVARSLPLAFDAVEGVDIDIAMLDAIIDPEQAAEGPLLYPEAGTNQVLRLDDPSPRSVSSTTSGAAIGAEDTVVTLTIDNPKVSSLTIECDAIVAVPTVAGGLDVWCTSQGVHGLRDELAAALGLAPASIRVRSPFVGGGFGGRATLPVEFVAVARGALLLGRPLRWLQTRSEQLTGQPQGRGLRTTITLSASWQGKLRGLEAKVIGDAGAAAHMQGALMVSALRQLPGLYAFDHIHTSGSVWLTNTTPVGAYRGAGQPEANHARERAIDVLARRLGLDPIEFRLANLVDAGPGPKQPRGVEYDHVRPRASLERAVELADLPRWRHEQDTLASGPGSIRIGIGVSCYAQTSGRGAPADVAELRLVADGDVEVFCASPSHGQGHEHTFAALIADRLGVDPERVRYVDADTAAIDEGLSTGGSRTTQVLGSLIDGACDAIIDEAKPLVAERLEVGEVDLVVAAAGYGLGPGLAVVGVPTRRVEWTELAAEASNGCVATTKQGSTIGATHPFGAHLSVVEVDTETGHIRLVRHVSVDDAGTVLQPVLFEGQQHGGSIAGLGQVLGEAIRYDDRGNPVSGSLGTYLVPTIDQIGELITGSTVTPTDRNALGTRGIGENGCNGATASMHNAVIDALAEWGIEHIDLPLDPEAIWRAVSVAASAAD